MAIARVTTADAEKNKALINDFQKFLEIAFSKAMKAREDASMGLLGKLLKKSPLNQIDLTLGKELEKDVLVLGDW